ncbi:MAG: extracellular solute-binding protein [Anaerolineae bacterium]|nr:extracellular solute-binding protein [Anaerolineae bacterium]
MAKPDELLKGKRLTRRDFLRQGGIAGGALLGGSLLAACAPTPEVVEVEKEVVVEKPVVETVVVEKEVPVEVEVVKEVEVTPTPVALGATPEERALSGIEALKAAGTIKEGDTFTIMHHSGQRNNIVPALDEWNALTGLNFQSVEIGLESDIYVKAMNEAVVRTGDYDIFLTFCNWIGDMAEAGLILDLTEWYEKYDPEVDHGPNAYVPPLDKFTTLYKGRRYAVGADDDAYSIFYRKDLMEDPDEQKAFEDKYGRKLEKPQTWEEFDQWVEFWDRPDEGMRGAHLFAERYFAYSTWAARFLSKGGIYFDDNMDPGLASEEGVTALEEMVRLTQNHMWEDTITGDWSGAYTRFPEGTAFCAMAWASLGKFAQDPESSKIAGKVGYAEVPGTMHNGTLVRAAPHVVGWSFSVSRYGKAPEAAYCWVQWFCGPTVGLEAIARVGTLDIFRQPWFDEPIMKEAYGEEFMAPLLTNTENCFPDIALRGAAEYLDKLNLHIQAANAGDEDPEAALKAAAEEWQEITDRLGRPAQAWAWREERAGYPQAIQDLWKKLGKV